MQPWFEMPPFPSGATIGFNNESWCNLMPYTTTGGVKKPARYRYNYEIRRTADSDNDFTNVFSLVDAANSYGTPNYVANMENMANMENWMRVFAANHAAGNWDSFGAQNAQNLYGYIGTQGTKYSLVDVGFQHRHRQQRFLGAGTEFVHCSTVRTPTSENLQQSRLSCACIGARCRSWSTARSMSPTAAHCSTAKYNAFIDNGLSVENPAAKIEPWLSQAQTSIASQLAAVNATSFTVNPTVTLSNNVAYVTGQAPVNVDAVWINGVGLSADLDHV